MVSSSSAAAAAAAVEETEAPNTTGDTSTRRKKTCRPKGKRPENTRAQKDKHNEDCRRSRLKIKRKHEEMEQELNEQRAENQKMKTQLQECQSKIGDMETANKEQKELLEKLAASGECLRLIINQWIANGQNFTVDQLVEGFAYGQVGEGLNYTKLSPCDPGPSSVANHHLHGPVPGFAAPAPGPSSVANQDLLFEFDNNFMNYFNANGYDLPDHVLPTVFGTPNNPANTNDGFTHQPAADHQGFVNG